MDDLFLLLFLLSPILLLVSLIKPDYFSKRFPKLKLNRKRLAAIFVVLFFVSVFGFNETYVPKETPDVEGEKTQSDQQVSSIEIDTENVVVKRVVDGDTIETEGGSKVRYIGIDTPETVDPGGSAECFGEEASKYNRELVEGKEVRLEKDVSETDKYGRLLRYVWIGDSMINEILVREGYARSTTYPPDVKYQDRFREAEKLAREENLGLWSKCVASPTPTNTLVPTKVPTVKSSQTEKYVAPTIAIYYPPTATPYVAPTSPPQSGGSGGTGGGSWTCDCSLTCSRDITSCAQAQWLLNSCGCTARDRDHDGIACDSAPLHCQN
jgi:endonuclease YncB( thermonuclease family)